MKSMTLKFLAIGAGLCLLGALGACGYMPNLGKVLPDKKSEYKKSESMPDLEVPPDLTANAINESMAIPNEQPLARARGGAVPAADRGVTEADEHWLSLAGSPAVIWPRLREFFQGQGYALELDDEELGVLETGWREGPSSPSAGGLDDVAAASRHKYKVFSEAGNEPGFTTLYLSRQSEARNGDDWVPQEADETLNAQLLAELDEFFGVTLPAPAPAPEQAVAAASPTGGGGAEGADEGEPAPRMVDLGEGKSYLLLPAEFDRAWRRTEVALLSAGLEILSKDLDKGRFMVHYADEKPRKKGVFSRLAFWRGDDGAKAASYQLSLTGVGKETELAVLNEEGDWETGDQASRLLALIQSRY